MPKILIILTILLALILIALVISLPRENQQFFSDTRSTILLILSILLFLILLFNMIQTI